MTSEKDTTFNKFVKERPVKRITVKKLKKKNKQLQRQYAPVRLMTAEEYEREKGDGVL